MDRVPISEWVCSDCKMTFSSSGQLSLHTNKFCPGTGDPYGLLHDDYSHQSSVTTKPALTVHHSSDDPKSLETAHQQSLAKIYADRAELTRQQHELGLRLSKIQPSRSAAADGSPHLLRKLHEIGTQNQVALQALRSQVAELTGDESSGLGDPTSSSLVEEVGRLRRLYLQQGGVDRLVLDQLSDLQAEATVTENTHVGEGGGGLHGRVVGHGGRRGNVVEERLASLEEENQRLQEAMAETAMYARHRDRVEREDPALTKETVESLRSHLDKLVSLQDELVSARLETTLAKLTEDVGQLVESQQRKDGANFPGGISDVDSKHDGMGGREVPLIYSGHTPPDVSSFTVFYDFVKGVEFPTKWVRLAVSLFDSNSALGPPCVFPEVGTEHASPGDSYLSAVIGVRQPSLEIPSASSVSLIVELQGGDDYDPAFTTLSWTKCNLFDFKGRLLTGTWRQPLKILPIYTAIRSSDLSTLPNAGSATIYFRVVSQEMLTSQAEVDISLNHHPIYSTLPQME